MVNDLILIDGQEGFVDLSFLEEWKLFINGVNRQAGYYTMPIISFRRHYKNRKEDRDDNLWMTDKPEDRLAFIGMQISYNNLARIYHKIRHNIDERVLIAKKQMKKAKTMKQRSLFNDKIRQLIKEQNQYDAFVRFEIIYSLLKKIPEKYYCRENKIVYVNKRGRAYDYPYPHIECTILKIKAIAIPYLENQFSLNRIELNYEEQAMIKSMKELLAIKDEDTTFDTYIDKWSERLIKRLNTGQL
jgi:hypothetical protein